MTTLTFSKMTRPTITKLTPAMYSFTMGRMFIIELSNGERFEISTDELVGKYCYMGTEDWKTGYDDEKINRMIPNNFQELIGAKY
jgi:hypothetical protein